MIISASEALRPISALKKIQKETSEIEVMIMDAANLGLREIFVDSTVVTNKAVNPFRDFTVDLTDNVVVLPNHGFDANTEVRFQSTDNLPTPLNNQTIYKILVIDNDRWQVVGENVITFTDVGEGDQFVKSIIESEKYFRAWRYFYLADFPESELYIISEVEKYFRKGGYSITKIENVDSGTFGWKIIW